MRCVSPGLTAGGGLKQLDGPPLAPRRQVSPGLTAGGGLKHGRRDDLQAGSPRFPRPHRRGRIETVEAIREEVAAHVSPGLTAGGGLKRGGCRGTQSVPTVSPGLTAGGGLKHLSARNCRRSSRVSPGLTAGGGLKRCCRPRSPRCTWFPPASPPGAD